jgi:hypothetical protein
MGLQSGPGQKATSTGDVGFTPESRHLQGTIPDFRFVRLSDIASCQACVIMLVSRRRMAAMGDVNRFDQGLIKSRPDDSINQVRPQSRPRKFIRTFEPCLSRTQKCQKSPSPWVRF